MTLRCCSLRMYRGRVRVGVWVRVGVRVRVRVREAAPTKTAGSSWGRGRIEPSSGSSSA